MRWLAASVAAPNQFRKPPRIAVSRPVPTEYFERT
jgi:hypothetical protein